MTDTNDDNLHHDPPLAGDDFAEAVARMNAAEAAKALRRLRIHNRRAPKPHLIAAPRAENADDGQDQV